MYKLKITSYGFWKYGISHECGGLLQDHGEEVNVLIKSDDKGVVAKAAGEFVDRIKLLPGYYFWQENLDQDIESFLDELVYVFPHDNVARSIAKGITLTKHEPEFFHYEVKG